MAKYLEIFNVTLAQYFVYRLNFLLWRFRVVLNLILVYFLWNAVYTQKKVILGYTQPEMLTYVLLISFLSNVVFSSKIQEISGDILNGNIINQLLKPVPIIKVLLTKEAADKFINIALSVVEMALIIFLLKPAISLQTDSFVIGISLLSLLIGICIAFFISFSVSMVAFWTAEVWAPRFIYFILVFMLAGNYFPLDIMPKPIYELLLLTPFPYFIFIPAKIAIHGFDGNTVRIFVYSIVWLILSYILTVRLWQKGMRDYSFYGK